MWFDDNINNKDNYEGLNEDDFRRLGMREEQYKRIVSRTTVDLTLDWSPEQMGAHLCGGNE